MPYLGLLNNASPCLINKDVEGYAYGVLAWMMSENLESMCIVISPVFTYHRGRLVSEEKRMIEQLESGNHNMDTIFS